MRIAARDRALYKGQIVSKVIVCGCFLKKSLMNQVLDCARQAARYGDWPMAMGYLQRGLQRTPDAPVVASQQVRSEFLEIALQILAEGDFKARWDVAKLLPHFGREAIAPLIEIARDEEADLEERWFAGRLLGQFKTAEAIAALVRLLQETDDADLAEIAANALAEIGPLAIAPLTALLAEPATCALAATALAQIATPEIVAPLLGVVDSSEATVRATAIAALGNFHDPRVPPVLIAALKDYATPVRKAAVVGLGLRATLVEVPLLAYLQPLLQDLNPEVCQQAALAIGRLRDDAAVAVLAAELQAELTPIAQKIVLARALAWIESPAALVALEQVLPAAAPPVALEIARAIGRISAEPLRARAAEILLGCFADGLADLDAPLAQALAHAWSLLGHPAARDALQQLEQHPLPGVRLHARMAGQKLADSE